MRTGWLRKNIIAWFMAMIIPMICVAVMVMVWRELEIQLTARGIIASSFMVACLLLLQKHTNEHIRIRNQWALQKRLQELQS